MEENQNYTPVPQGQGGKGLSLASMILGIVSIITCCFWWAGAICGIVGLILGILSIVKKAPGRGMAIAGIITSAAGLVLLISLLIFGAAIVAVYPDLQQYVQNYQ